ncbi:hypothetical protein PIB30_097705 [Stylosanthes scabra]|uniref:Uncharacterized protein n=1 Tax=Stylosanthes scabra TaxID=79078 RepID=A0ABU6WUR7_9FABA|nr:hypothetical protein [Stylosanthes scabra]
MEMYASQIASTEQDAVDQSLDVVLPSAGTVESSSDGSGESVVSLAKDSESPVDIESPFSTYNYCHWIKVQGNCCCDRYC